MIEGILLLVLACAVLSLLVRDLLQSVIILCAFSLLCAVLFYLFNAPDVAITEAAVGAGISTLVLVWGVKKTERRER